MRLKVFSAKSLALAMDRVRAELGPDAVIVTVDQAGPNGPVRITAAAEQRPEPIRFAEPALAPVDDVQPFDAEHLRAVMRYHGVPGGLAARLGEACSQTAELPLTDALAAGLQRLMQFQPLTGAVEKTVLLVGQSGQGKTLTAARLAAMARLARRSARVLTTDSEAAGALPQLSAFCAPLRVEVSPAPDPQALRRELTVPFPGLTIIDTAGVNPYALPDIEQLAHIVRASRAEPIWVLGCGSDALEAAEMADIFGSLGVRRVIATRADTTRRLAAVLTALTRSGLALAGLSGSPFVADPIAAGSPHDLAQRLLSRPDPARLARIKQKVA